MLNSQEDWNQQKLYPDYFNQIKKRPFANPILIAVDWRCLKFITQHRGLCLFCRKQYTISLYDFSFCYNKEIWILYINRDDQLFSIKLGHAIQYAAASKVLIIPFNQTLLWEKPEWK